MVDYWLRGWELGGWTDKPVLRARAAALESTEKNSSVNIQRILTDRPFLAIGLDHEDSRVNNGQQPFYSN